MDTSARSISSIELAILILQYSMCANELENRRVLPTWIHRSISDTY